MNLKRFIAWIWKQQKGKAILLCSGGQCLVGNFKRNDSASSRIADHELYQNQVAALSHLWPQELWKIENILKMMMRFDDMT